jgi:hypothetical protein
MPLTPLHYCVAYFFHRVSGLKLNLPALIVSSMVIDLENPFLFIFTKGDTTRLVLHSIFGALTFGLLISIFITIVVYPWFFKILFPKNRKNKEKCTLSKQILLSSIIGVLGHTIIDATHHEYNPLLFPFSFESIDYFVILGDWYFATILVYVLFSTFALIIIVRELKLGKKGFWERLLIGS